MGARLPFWWLLAAVLLLLMTKHAGAQTPAPCEPREAGGAGTSLQWGLVPEGAWAVWYCPRPFDWEGRAIYARPGGILEVSIDTARDAIVNQAAWRDTITRHFSAQRCAPIELGYEALCGVVFKALAAHRPPAPVWRVTPNIAAADRSRPVYAVTDGVRATRALPTLRAKADAVCTCGVTVVQETANTYCAVAGQPATQVALCSKAAL